VRTDHIISAMMDDVRTSETSVYFKESTWRYILKSCHLHTRRRENLIKVNLFITTAIMVNWQFRAPATSTPVKQVPVLTG
jgi:hypothetical protein